MSDRQEREATPAGVASSEGDYPEAGAARVWTFKGAQLCICIVRIKHRGHLCGYARLPHRPVKEPAYGGILSFVPVHGGITYAAEAADGTMVYGFDCSHSGDYSEWNPSGKQWTEGEVVEQTERMTTGILAAVAFEDRYLLAPDGEERAKVLDEYHGALGVDFDVRDNFGAMIGVLSGLARP